MQIEIFDMLFGHIQLNRMRVRVHYQSDNPNMAFVFTN